MKSSRFFAATTTGSSKAIALAHFKKIDPLFYRSTREHHSSLAAVLPAKRTRLALFEALVETVISQQLGVAAADTIYARVKAACNGRVTPPSLLKIKEEKLRAAGLSGAKTKTLKEISKAIQSGSLDLLELKTIPEAEASEKLLSIWGLGPWSVDMFMLFALGRSDVFSIGDLGLIRSIEMIYGLPKDAPREKLLRIAEKWAPHRTYASLLLWRARNAAIKGKKVG
jgi:DNA-3-methyladenine glycosylase II